MCLDAVLNLAFALSLLCFVVMHISLLLSNTTSVEVINTLLLSLFTLFELVYSKWYCHSCMRLLLPCVRDPAYCCSLGIEIMPGYLLEWQPRHLHACSLKSNPNEILFLGKITENFLAWQLEMCQFYGRFYFIYRKQNHEVHLVNSWFW